MEPSHKRHQVCPYVTWRCLREPFYHPWRCRDKRHSYSRPQEGLECLDHILPILHHHALAAKKGFTVLNMIRRTFPRVNRDDFQQLYASPGIRQLCRSLRTANGYKLFGESTMRSHLVCQWLATVSLWGKVTTPQHLSSWHSLSPWWLDPSVSSLRRESSP